MVKTYSVIHELNPSSPRFNKLVAYNLLIEYMVNLLNFIIIILKCMPCIKIGFDM